MAFADPQSVTIGGNAKTLNRTYTGTTQGAFVEANGDNRLYVEPRVSKAGRSIRTATIGNSKVTADPLVSTTNIRVNATVRLVIDRPAQGYSDAEILDIVKGLIGWATASTDAQLKKLIAGEN